MMRLCVRIIGLWLIRLAKCQNTGPPIVTRLITQCYGASFTRHLFSLLHLPCSFISTVKSRYNEAPL